MPYFLVKNAVMQTTAPPPAVTTGTATKTMLQIAPIRTLWLVEWGISFNAAALAAPIAVELIETGTVFATVTALAEADISRVDQTAALAADYMTLGSTTGTGFMPTTPGAEGTIVASRDLDPPFDASVLSQPFRQAFALGTYAVLTKGTAVRIRVTASAAVNCRCWMKLAT